MSKEKAARMVRMSIRNAVSTVLAALLCAGLGAGAALGEESCDAARADLRDEDGSFRFTVELADDEVERAQGLMHREALAPFAGMLFVYPEAGPVSFWMRNTLIPLDMLFFDESGRLEKIHENAVPLDETPIFGGNNIRYVLEVIGGTAAELEIEVGAELRHPSVVQEGAVWSC